MKHQIHISWHKLLVALLATVLAWSCWAYIAPKTNQANLERTLHQKQQVIDQKIEELNSKQSILEDQKVQAQQLEQDKTTVQKEKEQLLKDKAELERQLQTKRSVPAVHAEAAAGSCSKWMAQAGISATSATIKLIQAESGCNPNSINPYSGACGIAQELPCGKSGCDLNNPVCQLRWMNSYVIGRYGSWEGAYSTWLSRSPHWY